MNLYICFLFTIAASSLFQVSGRVVSARERVRLVEIKSIDRRFVDYADVDLDGTFQFKKVPQGLYKLSVVTQTGRAVQRTLEVGSTFADAKGKIAVTIDLSDTR